MSSSTPNKARKRRHSKACSRCRSRKIRCDFQYPTCGACLAAGKTCMGYDSIHHVEKPRSTITHLEQEVARLEAELRQITTQSNSITDITNAQVKRLTTGLAVAILSPERGSGKQENVLPLTSTFFLSTSTVPYLNSQTWEIVNPGPSHNDVATAINASSLPREVVDTMLKHYCEIYRPQYPAMEESTLYQACERVYNNAEPSSFDAFCVHITLAISTNTLRYRDAKRAEEATSGFWAAALVHLKQVGLASSWERLQAIQLLTHYGFLNPRDVDCVSSAAVATRLCLQLGLHQELPPSSKNELDATVLEDRKRLFFHSCSIDSACHSTRCRPYMWPRSPYLLETLDLGPNLSPTAHVWSLRKIESDITLSLYYPAWIPEDTLPNAPFSELLARLEQRLKEWRDTARNNLTLREKLEFHELHYQVQVLRLNRPSPRCLDPTGEMRKKALGACISVIKELSVIERLGKLFYLWHAAHCILEAAICLLASVLTGIELSPDMTHLARENVGICSRYIQAAPILLRKIARRWTNIAQHASTLEPISTQILEILQRWSGGDIINYSDTHELRQKLNQISLFSPFPAGARPDANEPLGTAGTALYLVPEVSALRDAPIDNDWGILRPSVQQSSSSFVDPHGIFDGDALAWDFSGMDPDEIFVSLLDRGQPSPSLLGSFAGPAPVLDLDSSSHGVSTTEL